MNINHTKLIVAFIFIWTIPFGIAKADIIDDVAALFKAGNSKNISAYLAPSVEMTILTEENVYSKVQAEAALKDFFSKHSPSSTKVIHRLTSNPNYRFSVIVLATEQGTFRTSISFKNISGKFLINEIRIEIND